jgi:hypothetical protein
MMMVWITIDNSNLQYTKIELYNCSGIKVSEVSIADLSSYDFKQQFDQESRQRGQLGNQAWDDVDYVDLEVDDDFIQKSLSIQAGEDYDTRVTVPVDFTDDELLKYMKMAHEHDMTFNAFVELALRDAIDQHHMLNDVAFPLEKKNKKKKLKKQN